MNITPIDHAGVKAMRDEVDGLRGRVAKSLAAYQAATHPHPPPMRQTETVIAAVGEQALVTFMPPKRCPACKEIMHLFLRTADGDRCLPCVGDNGEDVAALLEGRPLWPTI